MLYVQSHGVRHGKPDVLARLATGEDVDPSEYTFRTTVSIETSAPELAWLNDGVFVAVGHAGPAASPTTSTSSSSAPLRRRRRGEQVLTRTLAAPARIGTPPAVLVVMGVALALLGALPAGDQAGFELAMPDRRVGVGLASDDARGRHAGIGAVEAEAQAALEVADVVLSERRVGADRAVRGAHAALVDAPGEHARDGGGRRLGRPAPSRADALRCSLWPPCTRFA